MALWRHSSKKDSEVRCSIVVGRGYIIFETVPYHLRSFAVSLFGKFYVGTKSYMNMYNIYIYDKNNPRFLSRNSAFLAFLHLKSSKIPSRMRTWCNKMSDLCQCLSKNKEKQWFKRVILHCFQYFVFWKGNQIVSFAIPHVICWYHSSWWLAYNFQDSTGWSQTTQFLGMFFSMKTMFPGWFSMWIQGNSNTFVSSPRWSSYDFHTWSMNCTVPASLCGSLEKMLHVDEIPKVQYYANEKLTSPLKKGHFKKQGSLPTTIFSRTCKFSGKQISVFFVTAFVLCVCVCTNSFYHSIKIQIPQVLFRFFGWIQTAGFSRVFSRFRLDPLGPGPAFSTALARVL